eukprot:TRINITY_DN12645_c0_g1_i1.p1 TRINITY_DN12645_c0_g1~~TRINITY_DN12645_c0_g1_i1.p1  ORF type:complete len:404 (-),score=23.22 TRINITY_DN12645_c0_g1_i1:135-1346(-)
MAPTFKVRSLSGDVVLELTSANVADLRVSEVLQKISDAVRLHPDRLSLVFQGRLLQRAEPVETLVRPDKNTDVELMVNTRGARCLREVPRITNIVTEPQSALTAVHFEPGVLEVPDDSIKLRYLVRSRACDRPHVFEDAESFTSPILFRDLDPSLCYEFRIMIRGARNSQAQSVPLTYRSSALKFPCVNWEFLPSTLHVPLPRWNMRLRFAARVVFWSLDMLSMACGVYLSKCLYDLEWHWMARAGVATLVAPIEIFVCWSTIFVAKRKRWIDCVWPCLFLTIASAVILLPIVLLIYMLTHVVQVICISSTRLARDSWAIYEVACAHVRLFGDVPRILICVCMLCSPGTFANIDAAAKASLATSFLCIASSLTPHRRYLLFVGVRWLNEVVMMPTFNEPDVRV